MLNKKSKNLKQVCFFFEETTFGLDIEAQNGKNTDFVEAMFK